MSPNVPWTRITGTGAVERQAKSLAPGGGTPGAWAAAGAASTSRPAMASTATSVRIAVRVSHPIPPCGSRAPPSALRARSGSGSGAPPSAAAIRSAIAGPCLKPWPEPPPSSHTPGCSGWRAAMKCESGDSS